MYVQSILEHKEDMIRRVLYAQGGRIYICGSTAMSKEVLAIIQRHVTEHIDKNVTYVEGEKEVDRLLREKKICMEAWN